MPADLTRTDYFPQPENDEIKIWRYLTLPKLLSMLNQRQLHFTQVARLDDPWEGALTEDAKEHFRKEDIFGKTSLSEREIEDRDFWARGRYVCYVNCWCGEEQESNALWRIYSGETGGVAIRSTYSTLAQILPQGSFLAPIRYQEYDSRTGDEVFAPILIKRRAFAYESEIRAVLVEPNSHRFSSKSNWDGINELPHFKKCEIEPEDLIEKIIVSPFADSWYFDVVKETTSRLKFNIPVEQSALGAQPSHLLDGDGRQLPLFENYE